MADEFGIAIWCKNDLSLDMPVAYRQMTQEQVDSLAALLSLLQSFDIVHDFDIWST